MLIGGGEFLSLMCDSGCVDAMIPHHLRALNQVGRQRVKSNRVKMGLAQQILSRSFYALRWGTRGC